MVHSTIQLVHIPYNSQEIGLFTLRSQENVTFWMCFEESGRQVFPLVYETTQLVKGRQLVSMVHHYLYWYSILTMLLARIEITSCCGYHRSIEYSTMITDHAKFESDLHF
ncbi:uncharacterized protein LOC128557203 [Mercenaria mercenaria]|uniref:uncharacterized protein LOC128557203 n=1 Tax=Mercenaria mercenaria TaxID=6596 RepID=UPI00234EAABA|nr:uncharacterized protein LOC128557203 [Mercenaria mercenaria]